MAETNNASPPPAAGEEDKKKEEASGSGSAEEKKKPPTPGPEVDKKELREQFEAFAKFGDKSADGKTIKLTQSDKWFKQAKVIDPGNKGKEKVTTTDTGIAFRKVAKSAPKLSFTDWSKYLDEISKAKEVDANTIKGKLVSCGKPGFTGATAVKKSAVTDRLTDSSKYGGTHKQRFEAEGKGRGKAVGKKP